MPRLTRRNYLVDDAKVRELASRRNTSASDAVRQAVDFALAAEQVMAAMRALHARGGLDDPFTRLPDGDPDGP